MRKSFSKWFLLAALILGLGARICAQDPCFIVNDCHEMCHHHPGDDSSGDSHDDSDCPLNHHGMCSHANPLLSSFDQMSAPLPPGASLLGMSLRSDAVPDGPILEEDVPPIV